MTTSVGVDTRAELKSPVSLRDMYLHLALLVAGEGLPAPGYVNLNPNFDRGPTAFMTFSSRLDEDRWRSRFQDKDYRCEYLGWRLNLTSHEPESTGGKPDPVVAEALAAALLTPDAESVPAGVEGHVIPGRRTVPSGQ